MNNNRHPELCTVFYKKPFWVFSCQAFICIIECPVFYIVFAPVISFSDGKDWRVAKENFQATWQLQK